MGFAFAETGLSCWTIQTGRKTRFFLFRKHFYRLRAPARRGVGSFAAKKLTNEAPATRFILIINYIYRIRPNG